MRRECFQQVLTRHGENLTNGAAGRGAAEFVVQNSVVAVGNALPRYEPRYDLCRCRGLWPRTEHAISRSFVAYNRTERVLRPKIPTYAGGVWRGYALQVLAATTT